MNQPAHAIFPYSSALITGASSGLGEEFAIQLAPLVRQLILVARRQELLDRLAEELRRQHASLEVICCPCDLRELSERQRLMDFLGQGGLRPELLVNNAGLGDYGDFASSDWSKVESQLRVNVEALTHLTHHCVKAMQLARHGAIIQVSSLASSLPIPDFAVYAASKAYVTSFSEALRLELADDGIQVLALCPGPVKTGFGEVARREAGADRGSFRSMFYEDRRSVVRCALAGLRRGRARSYPGWKIRAAAWLLASMPIGLIRRMMATRPRR